MRMFITLCVVLCVNQGYAMLIPEMVCHQNDLHSMWNHDLERINEETIYWNIVEQFTVLEERVIEKAGEKLASGQEVGFLSFVKLGFWRKIHLFFLVVCVSYLYWVYYAYLKFRVYPRLMDQFIQPIREFYMRKLVVGLYLCLLGAICYYVYFTLIWVGHYVEVSNGREERMRGFMNDYETVVNHSSRRFACWEDVVKTELEEINAFHRRIERRFLEVIPNADLMHRTMLQVQEKFRKECNVTIQNCGFKTDRMEFKKFDDHLFIINNLTIHPLTKLKELTANFEEIRIETLLYEDKFLKISEAVRERLMLVKNLYPRIDALFQLPAPTILRIVFFLLLGAFYSSVFFSLFAVLSMFRGFYVIQEFGATQIIAFFLRKCYTLILVTTCLSLVFSWIVILFSGASHSVYLNVLCDNDMEVLGNLNVTDDNGTFHFSFRDFLRSTNEDIVQDVLKLNPRFYLNESMLARERIRKWKEKVLVETQKSTDQVYATVEEFCEKVEGALEQEQGPWVDKRRSEVKEILELCHLTSLNKCLFCDFKDDVARTATSAYKVIGHRSFVSNRTGSDIEEFRNLHEKFRMQIWFDTVVPITYLEGPAMILLGLGYALSFMFLVAIMFVESPGIPENWKSQNQFYDQLQIDCANYWYNF